MSLKSHLEFLATLEEGRRREGVLKEGEEKEFLRKEGRRSAK